MKRFKIIHIPNQYLLVVDKTADKKLMRRWYYDSGDDEEVKLQQLSLPEYHYLSYQLIIAHFSLNNSPILEGVDVLPELDEVSVLSYKAYPDDSEWQGNHWLDFNEDYRNVWIEGYKANPARFIEEDLRKAIQMARVTTPSLREDDGYYEEYTEDEIIQSISQPKMPLFFEAETETFTGTEFSEWSSPFPEPIEKIKTITNSKGQEEWVGKYIY